MPFPFAPRIIYGAGTNLYLTNTQGMWSPDRIVQGGKSESATGIPETYVLRKDSLLNLVIRITEAEYADVVAWIDWCLESGSQGHFTFYPDQAVGTSFNCWLLRPSVGEEWSFRRVQGYVKVLELDVTLRARTAGQLLHVPIG